MKIELPNYRLRTVFKLSNYHIIILSHFTLLQGNKFHKFITQIPWPKTFS
jgi:hypothetical protein